ncbi:MAG: SIS domain-containing protein, partial [Clostridia bacterium]|nr:SIS domain-containing protein [Clostridia bacterium]
MDRNKDMKDILRTAYAAFDIEAGSLAATAAALDAAEFEKAVIALASAERIGASGCGHSGIACRHFAHLMCCIGRPARFLSPSEALHGGMGFFKPGDVFVWASRGGKTDELFPIVDTCRAFG